MSAALEITRKDHTSGTLRALAERFGPRLWSVRLLVFVTPDGPVRL